MAIELSKDARQRLVRALQNYFAEKLDQEIGDLAAGLLLDFLLEELGPPVYNQAIRDAQAWLQDKLVDLDGQLYEPEPREGPGTGRA